MTTAYLIFSDTGAHWACRWLRRGYRHVEVLLPSSCGWVGLGGKIGALLEVTALPHEVEGRLAELLPAGVRIVPVVYEPQARRSVIGLYTCVGLVKAALGLRDWWVITPWQLCRRVTDG